MEEVEIYQIVGKIIVWLLTGMGLAAVIYKIIDITLTFVLKMTKMWILPIDYIVHRKEFRNWLKYKK